MNGCRARAHVIGERERASPLLRSHWPSKRPQQWKGVRVGDGKNRDFSKSCRVPDWKSLGIGCGASARGQRITRVERHIGNRASLGAEFITPCALWIGVPLKEAVLSRVRVDKTTDSTVLGSH